MNDALLVNTLAGRGIGDNSDRAPLAEVLEEELAADGARAEELLAAAREARIETAADAGKVADLMVLIAYRETEIDRNRTMRKAPLLRDQRAIEAAYAAITGPLERARIDTLSAMLSKWRAAHPEEHIPTSIATISARREPVCCIEDLPAAVDWLLSNHPGSVAQAARTMLGAIIRAAGVDAIDRGDVQIPGVSITTTSKIKVR